jgi:histone arginine demethylase JMJD6
MERYQQIINRAKRDARSELNSDDWNKKRYAQSFPEIYCSENIDRVSNPTVEWFEKAYKMPGIPALLTDCIDHWPAMKEWTIEKLTTRFRNQSMKVGEDDDGSSVRMKLKYFARYMKENDDDCPLNVFDSSFCEKHKLRELLADYLPLKYFSHDFYQCADPKRTPPNRWFIIGPKRSGTGIHVDPMGTSAWNALISGVKLWCLFHPKTPDYLVKPKPTEKGKHPDEAITWFTTVYNRVLSNDWPQQYPPVIGLQLAGEVFFVPSGWYHVVFNVEDTIAVTENFCDESNFERCVKKAFISRPAFLEHWIERLRLYYPYFYEQNQDIIRRVKKPSTYADSSSSTSSDSDNDGDQDLDEENFFQVTQKRKISPLTSDLPEIRRPRVN